MTSTNPTDRASLRSAVLAHMGASGAGTMLTWPTATAQVDLDRGMILIAADLEVAPDDMEAITALLELAGYDNGTDGPFPADPGEPNEIMGALTWNLSLSAPAWS